MNEHPVVGIIGGSGLYSMPGIGNVEELTISTPFGKPSSPIIVGTLEGLRVAFLARHGIGHIYTPSEVNYRANIFAFKSLGIERIVSVSACGSLREDFAPGHIVIPNQLFDFTKGKRKNSFFGKKLVAHVGAADPFCNDFSKQLYAALKTTKATTHLGGTAITIEGPRFSTRSESNVFRSWDMDLIGMTAAPEAFLAREAEMCYSAMFHVTDYDVWHTSEEPVSVDAIVKIMKQNIEYAQEAIRALAANYKSEKECECGEALKSALFADPNLIPKKTMERLAIMVGKYYK